MPPGLLRNKCFSNKPINPTGKKGDRNVKNNPINQKGDRNVLATKL